MFNAITSLFKQLLEGDDLAGHSDSNPELAIAALLCEVAGADHQLDQQETLAKQSLLCHLLKIEPPAAIALLAQAQEKVDASVSLYDFTSHLREMSQPQRYELVKAMWQVAHADGEIDPIEDAVIRKVAELLYVDHSEFIRAKLSVIGD